MKKETNQDLVSIIMPVYNVEKYLNEAIDSVLSQTYPNIELILINDGSTDRSKDICELYAKDNSNIVLVNQSNGGLSLARNVGIDISSGRYLVFLDSDDLISKNMVEKLYNMLINTKTDIAICQMSSDISKMGQGSDKIKTFSSKESIEIILKENAFSTSAGAKMFKKEMFDGVRFPVGKIYEDYATIYLSLDKAEKVSYTNKALYFYRENPSSITHVSFSNKRLQYFDASNNVKDYLQIKYPDLLKYANLRETRYAISFYKQMIDSKFIDVNTEKYLRTIIKKNIFKYMFSNYSILSRFYGLAIMLCPKLLKKLSR